MRPTDRISKSIGTINWGKGLGAGTFSVSFGCVGKPFEGEQGERVLGRPRKRGDIQTNEDQ